MNNRCHCSFWSWVDIIFYALCAGIVLVFIWAHRFLPLQDYPDWLYHGFAFSQVLKGQPLEFYQLLTYPVPNSVSTIVLGILNLVLPIEAAGKIFLSAYVALFSIGSLYLINSLEPDKPSPLSYIPFVFLLSFPFFHGQINYLFALGILFFAIGYLIRRRNNPQKIKLWAIAAFSIVLFFCHATSFAAFVIFTVVFSAFKDKKSWRKYTAAIAPSLILLTIYSINQIGSGFKFVYSFDSLFGSAPATFFLVRPFWFLCYFSPLPTFYPYALAMNTLFLSAVSIINYVVAMLFSFVCLYWVVKFLKSRLLYKPLWLTVWFFIIIILISPVSFSVNAFPAQRFLYPAFWLLLASLAPLFNQTQQRAKCQLIKVAVITMVAIQALYLYAYTSTISNEMNKTYTQLKNYGLGSDFSLLLESHYRYADTEHGYKSKRYSRYLWQDHCPLNRLPFYISIEDKTYADIFFQGIFHDKKFRGPQYQFSLAGLPLEKYPHKIIILGNNKGNRVIAEFYANYYGIDFYGENLLVLKKR